MELEQKKLSVRLHNGFHHYHPNENWGGPPKYNTCNNYYERMRKKICLVLLFTRQFWIHKWNLMTSKNNGVNDGVSASECCKSCKESQIILSLVVYKKSSFSYPILL